jgi:hypothetical protein
MASRRDRRRLRSVGNDRRSASWLRPRSASSGLSRRAARTTRRSCCSRRLACAAARWQNELASGRTPRDVLERPYKSKVGGSSPQRPPATAAGRRVPSGERTLRKHTRGPGTMVRRVKRSSASIPRANSREASERLRPRPAPAIRMPRPLTGRLLRGSGPPPRSLVHSCVPDAWIRGSDGRSAVPGRGSAWGCVRVTSRIDRKLEHAVPVTTRRRDEAAGPRTARRWTRDPSGVDDPPR